MISQKMKDFDTFTKIAQQCGRFGQALKSCPKSNKSPNLVTLIDPLTLTLFYITGDAGSLEHEQQHDVLRRQQRLRPAQCQPERGQ